MVLDCALCDNGDRQSVCFRSIVLLVNRSLVEDRQFCQSDADQFVSNKEAKTVKELGNDCTLLPVQIMSSRTRLPTSKRSEAESRIMNRILPAGVARLSVTGSLRTEYLEGPSVLIL